MIRCNRCGIVYDVPERKFKCRNCSAILINEEEPIILVELEEELEEDLPDLIEPMEELDE